MLISKGLFGFNRSMNSQFQFLAFTLADRLNRQQQVEIEYQREETSVLLQQNEGRRKAYTDFRRRRLAEIEGAIARQELEELAQFAGPDIIRTWFRMLVIGEWTFDSGNGKGRPLIDSETEDMIIKLLRRNPS